ncbi:MAG: tight adherence protein [Actinomycetota bacterium]|jgi:tight adherence protein C|nr:tight adherence protein [Actinomycetota bacterium]MEA2932709.1 tight adherence protein [Actinomycetota bacterium]
MELTFLLPLFLAVAGATAVAVGLTRARPAGDVGQYLRDLDENVTFTDEFERKLQQPFIVRVVRPLGAGIAGSVGRLTPRNYLDQTHRKLLLAGLSGSMRAEEFVVGQLAATGACTLGALIYVGVGHPTARVALLVLIMGPLIGLMLPSSWLARKLRERQSSILKDLPDTLDLLAISVEAGMGFEGALAIVCQHFDSPLAEEFARTLHEMELGLPRRDAFQNLKRRTEVPELSNLVLALLQADALGIPIGRVLKTQASEMRNKRRQWAREKAAKLPVKMLFPLVLFVFPAIMVVILGPAAAGISQAFK